MCRLHVIAMPLAALVLLACVGCGGNRRYLMPTPNVMIGSPDDPFANVEPHFRNNKVDLLYMTDRVREGETEGLVHYGSERSRSIAFGSCVVEIGHDVSWDALVAASLTHDRAAQLPLEVRRITEMGRFPDDPLALVRRDGKLVEDPVLAARKAKVAEAFREQLRRRLRQTSRKEAYVFVHGVFTEFEEAADVLAGLWHFLGREGVPILYTWPAGLEKGALRAYTYDRESSEFTVFHLKELLRLLASCPELKKIHLIGHSRGTDVVTSAVRELVIEARGGSVDARKKYRIGNIVLAAPDLDLQVVIQRLGGDRVFQGADRITIYVSENDSVVGLAHWLFASNRRVGQLRFKDLHEIHKRSIAAIGNVHIIDVRAQTKGHVHDYFYASPAASSDLILLLRDNRNPGGENGRPLIQKTPGFWVLEESYPVRAADESG